MTELTDALARARLAQTKAIIAVVAFNAGRRPVEDVVAFTSHAAWAWQKYADLLELKVNAARADR